MKQLNYIKTLFNSFFLFYFILSIILSLNVGLTHDEAHHDLVWQTNKKIYSNYFFGSNSEINFLEYPMNFYGLGFQIFSYPIEKYSILYFHFFQLKFIHYYLSIHQ